MPPTLTGADTGEPALAAALEALPGWDRADTVRSTSLSAGITNRNYLLESGDERVVVRVFGADTELLGIDRVAEDVAAHLVAVGAERLRVVAVGQHAGHRIGTLLGHISAQNPQNSAFDGTHHATAVFRGPHGYISPSWYATQTSVVPTWNFAVVHVSGRPRAITDRDKAHDLLATLIRKNEQRVGSTGYDFSTQPREYVDRMMQGIRPFEMEIEAIEGKFKLGQERAAGDRAGVVEHLKRDAYRERSLSGVRHRDRRPWYGALRGVGHQTHQA